MIVPNECYGEILENIVLPWLSEIEDERRLESPDNPWKGVWNYGALLGLGRQN